MDTVFERVIGLGYWCLTKGQINGYFNTSTPINQTKKDHGDLFDWLFIDNYDKLALTLQNELTDLFNLEDLQPVPGGYKNTRLFMNWTHLENNFSCETYNKQKLNSNHSGFYISVKSKIEYLVQKFISAKNSKTLYIISHPNPSAAPNLETLIKVRDSLTIIRDGDKNFILLYIPHEKQFESIENILVFEARNLKCEWNAANSVRWKEILDQFKFTPDIWD